MKTTTLTLRALGIALAVLFTTAAVSAKETKVSDDTTVYHAHGKKRVHVKGCKRLTKDPEELAKLTKMTLGEAKTKGLVLCSRCPGSTTPGKTNPKAEKATDEAKDEDEVIVYHAKGKKRVHVKGCRRLTKDPEELQKNFTTMTLEEAKKKGLQLCSRCPGSTTEGRKKAKDAGTE